MAGSTVDPDIPIGEYHLRVSQKPVTQPSQPFDGAATKDGIETLTNKTITTPTIIAPTVASGVFDAPQLTTPLISSTGFYYAQHNHSAAINGGTLSTYETVRSWTNYTPQWTASITNPTLGTGALAQGRYKILGSKTVHVDIEFTTGSSGFSGGSGTYQFSLPASTEMSYGIVRNSSIESTGTARMYDSSASTYYTGVSVAASNQNYLLVYTNQTIRPTQPFTWSNGDQIIISCTYEFQ